MTPEEEDLRIERARRLIEAAPVTPMEWELDTVRRVVALARHRLELPEQVVIRWRYPLDGASRGAHVDGVLFLGLDGGTGADDLAAVLFHELRHLADHFAGEPFDRATWEERADTFSATMMTYWRAGTVPEDDEEDEEDGERMIASDSARGDYLLGLVRRRLSRLRSRIDPQLRLEFSALARQVEELAREKR